MSYGGLASVGRFPAGACVELFAGDERVAHTYASTDGMFAFQFVVPGNADGADFELRVTDEALGHTESISMTFSSATSARIAYEPETTPLVVDGARMRFTGWLAPAPLLGPTRISGAWMVNWTRGAVALVSPTPALSAPFMAEVAGSRGDCGAIVSRHGSGAAGGCWWPRGGGGCAPICTLREFREGMCPTGIGGTCTSGRGCAVIDVDERHSPAPPPETDLTIPVAPPAPDLPDAGPPDAPALDGPAPDQGMVF